MKFQVLINTLKNCNIFFQTCNLKYWLNWRCHCCLNSCTLAAIFSKIFKFIYTSQYVTRIQKLEMEVERFLDLCFLERSYENGKPIFAGSGYFRPDLVIRAINGCKKNDQNIRLKHCPAEMFARWGFSDRYENNQNVPRFGTIWLI